MASRSPVSAAPAAAASLAPGVLISSASRKVPLLKAVRTALDAQAPKGKVYAGDTDANCVAAALAEGFWHMPRLNDIDTRAIVDWCRQHAVGAVIPTRDGELPIWAAARAELSSAGVHVMVSPRECLVRCVDKLQFAEFTAAAGFQSIPTAGSPDELPRVLRFVVKERFGAGARNQALDVDRATASDAAARLEQPVFQPFIGGVEISADAYVAASGLCIGVVLRTRDVIVAGESQVTTTVRDERLEAIVGALAERLGVYGHCVIQVIVDPAGQPWLLECNARFGGASTLAIAAGLDSFGWFLRECRGDIPTAADFRRNPGRLRQVRYPADLVSRLEEGK